MACCGEAIEGRAEYLLILIKNDARVAQGAR